MRRTPSFKAKEVRRVDGRASPAREGRREDHLSKPPFDKICIAGVGLIGGSIGLAIKKRRLARLVVGVARRKSSARDAVRFGAVDVATLDLKEGVSGADLVILCGPVSVIAAQLKTISKYASPKTIIIDVGSSKSLIEAAAKKHLRRGTFVGCHPMAGLEKKGVRFAEAGLFEDAVCFMTRRHLKVETFWRKVGCRPVILGAKQHDAWVAQFSHLPHAIAFALFQNAPKHPSSLKASNPSLRDLARISKSDPRLWADIFFSNRREVLLALARFQKDLGTLATAVRQRRAPRVAACIAKANRISHRVAP